LAKLNGDWSPVPTWAYGDYDIYSKDLMTRYIYSVYHGMWCLRGNELGPRDSTMAAAGGFLMIFGAMITAILFGEIAVIMTVLTRRSTQFQNTIENGFMTANELQLPSTLTTKILDYVTSSKAQLSMQNEFDYFSRLISPSLQSQVSSCLYGPLLEKNAALASSPQAAQVIIKRLKQRLFKPEEVVVTEGTVSDSMYFVLRGELSVWVSDPLKESKLICYLGEGAHFGEVGLVYKTLRTAAVISQDFSTVAQLMETDFNEVTTKFPVLIESLRKATDLYEDPWKLYIIEGFTQAAYYKYLPRSTMQECVYLAEVEWIKPGDYLFRPGDKADRAYLVTEGLLELSFTFNDVNLHRLKRTNHILKIEHTPPLQRRRYSAIEFSDWDVDLVSCSLKSCYEVMPLINDTGVVGSKLYGESHEVPLKPLGEYPQEVILEQFEGGVLLNSNLLIMDCTHELQCKAKKLTKVYSISSALVHELAVKHSRFDHSIASRKEKLSTKWSLVMNPYDVAGSTSAQGKVKRLWKTAIVRTILFNRKEQMKGAWRMVNLVTKIRSVLACEEAGNFELASKVILDVIPPHYITEDGNLDPYVSAEDVKQVVTSTHPIMQIFLKLQRDIIEPKGTIYRMMSSLQRIVSTQGRQLHEMRVDLYQAKVQALELLEQYDPVKASSFMAKMKSLVSRVVSSEEHAWRRTLTSAMI
jgi:CRP-like cAMP-binding protein